MARWRGRKAESAFENVSGQVVVGDHNIVIKNGDTTHITRFEGPEPEIVRLPHRPLALGPDDEPVGRDEFCDEVLALLRERTPVQVYGPAGVGKSAVLRDVARRAPGDVVYLTAGHGSLDDLCQELFESCYDAGTYRPSDTKRRRLLGDLDALVVVDDVHLAQDDLDRLLDHVPRCVFLFGGRERTLWGRGRAFDLPPLDDTAGRELIVRELGDVPADEPAVATALREASGRPAVLLRCGAFLRDTGVKGEPTSQGLDDATCTVLLVASLSEPARQVLSVLAGLPDIAVSVDVLATLVGIDVGAGVHDELRRSRLTVAEHSRHRVTPDVAAVVAREAGDRPTRADVTAAARRLTGWAAEANVVAEADLLVRILELAYAATAYAEVRALARAVGPRLAMAWRLGAWARVLALGLRAAQAARATGDETYFLREIETNRACRGGVVTTAAAVGTTALLSRRMIHHVIGKGARPKAATVKTGTLGGVKGGIGVAVGTGIVAAGIGGAIVIPKKVHHHRAEPHAPLSVKFVSFTENHASPPYRINGTYAQLDGVTDPAAEKRVNDSLRTVVDDHVTGFRTAALRPPPGSPKIMQTFSGPARILLKGPRFVSVMYAFDTFIASQLHDTLSPALLDYDLSTGRLLTARDIFRADALQGRLAQRVIETTKGDSCIGDPLYVDGHQDIADALAPRGESGAGTALAEAGIALTRTSVDLYFAPYSVGAFACGVPVAHLPYATNADLLRPGIATAGSPTPTHS